MSSVNIPRSIQDPNYRYKMPLLQMRIEGRGINIHTTLLNLKEVAKSLRTNPDFILKFFGYELSIQINDKNDVVYLNGEIPENDVLKVLDRFIEKFILCSLCKLPEMFIEVSKDERNLVGHCFSCGKKTQIDSIHKLSAYIIKNPPQNQSEFKTLQSEKGAFEKSVTATSEHSVRRRQLLMKIRESTFIPYHQDSKALFDEVEAYMQEGFPIAKDYKFDENHVEVVYKLIKRLRLEKEKWDRIGYILFRHLFDIDRIKNLTDFPKLFQRVLHRHNLTEFVSMEFLLNIQWLYYEAHKGEDYTKVIPTRLAKLMENEYISDV